MMVKRGLNREVLVGIAHAYVTEHGLDALTMRRLAAAAGVTPGALYKHVRDRRDLQRAMAESIVETVNLGDIDVDSPSVEQVMACCKRLRLAMLDFRSGGRIVAGSYAPFAATIALGQTLRALLAPLAVPDHDAGRTAFVLRSYTVGFVIEEQAYLEMEASGEWEAHISSHAAGRDDVESDDVTDVIGIMTGDRDAQFVAGLETILTGVVR